MPAAHTLHEVKHFMNVNGLQMKLNGDSYEQRSLFLTWSSLVSVTVIMLYFDRRSTKVLESIILSSPHAIQL